MLEEPESSTLPEDDPLILEGGVPIESPRRAIPVGVELENALGLPTHALLLRDRGVPCEERDPDHPMNSGLA
jgi:hypothetical protein